MKESNVISIHLAKKIMPIISNLERSSTDVLLLKVETNKRNIILGIDLYSEKAIVFESKEELLGAYYCSQCGCSWAHATPIDSKGKIISNLSEFWDYRDIEPDIIIDEQDLP